VTRADLDQHADYVVAAFLRACAPAAHPQAVSR
jgi:hypothetical protein